MDTGGGGNPSNPKVFVACCLVKDRDFTPSIAVVQPLMLFHGVVLKQGDDFLQHFMKDKADSGLGLKITVLKKGRTTSMVAKFNTETASLSGG
jgi:hypothetical protein